MTCKMNMSNGMLTISPSKKTRIVHVETELGIVNIYLNLRNEKGQRVEKVTMKGNEYAGQPKVTVTEDGRFIEQAEIE